MLEFRLDDEVTCGGQPSGEDLQRYCDAGFRTVVDLRRAGEEGHPADEREHVERLGMRYVAFPVDGATQLTLERARELDAVLAQVERPVLIHCKSSNRVGALLALSARHDQGRSVEEAIAWGRKAGLAGAEAQVRALM